MSLPLEPTAASPAGAANAARANRDAALRLRLQRAHLSDRVGRWAITGAGVVVLLGVFMILAFLCYEASALVLNPSKHPDGTMEKLFVAQKYEGYDSAQYVWQTEAGEGHQAKYGVPLLIWGTIKGALWAMFFSTPLALLTAIFVSEFAPTKVRSWCKATIELLAGVPTVVVGFVAFAVLAPAMNRYYIENSAYFSDGLWVLILVQIAVFAFSASWLASRIFRLGGLGLAAKAGGAVLAVAAGLAAAKLAGLALESVSGPVLRPVFGVREFSQLNAALAGFCLGFAIVPIVFSVAEDALRAVPQSFREASLGLGGSKWETALYIVVPAALPGIFAALMLGLARAVGETMIVLMASGNTAIFSASPFTGMRTMSAAIAIEASEKAQGSTGYYVLFFVGAVLFALTLVLNVITAQVMQRLRKRFTVD